MLEARAKAKKGQKPPVVEFCGYSGDKDLCVVTGIYIAFF